ncbi:MAG TPA: GAF domain-containing SpoIIE family protein phosphatase, partial [Actinomycetota bacterium]|nr:GAF domain-containing SpoIIE family protein phosphatase [Actinomycetota bacterium]
RARLYEAERKARLEAETSRSQLQFLLEASTLLAESMDIHSTLAAVADLVVRTMADACLIDLAGDDLPAFRIGRGRDTEPMSEPGHALAPGGAPAKVMAAQVPLLVPAGPIAGEVEAFPGVGSYLGVPLAVRGRVLGCLSLVRDAGDLGYSQDDLVLAQDLARRVGLALDHVRLFDAHRHIAMTLQESLLPPELPAIPGIELAARYRPAVDTTEVGGDFYDVFPVGGGAWAFAIGDISGKGVEAAALTSLARYTVRAAAREHRQPREILSLLNEAVLAEGSGGRFLTIVFARLRQQAGGLRLTAASGGHPLPLLLRADGSVERIARPGTLLGFVETVHLPEKVTELGTGDVVIFYTDGLTDVRGPEGTFGEERLIGLLRSCQGLPAETTAARLEEGVLAFLRGEPRDDLALLVLRVTRETPA